MEEIKITIDSTRFQLQLYIIAVSSTISEGLETTDPETLDRIHTLAHLLARLTENLPQ